jgi:glycosyltransferase involved in cell wall biosynthesis
VRIAIIGTDGLPARYGGFETFAEQIAPLFAAAGHQVLVIGSGVGREEAPDPCRGVRVMNLPMSANGMSSIPFDLWSFVRARRHADQILLLGVSAGLFVPLMKMLAGRRRIVINVDGLESRRAKWGGFAKRYLGWSERVAIAFGDAIICDNQGISDLVRQGHGRSPATIAYGHDHVVIPDRDVASKTVRERFELEPDEYCLTIARMEPENQILEMLEGFLRSRRRRYAIVGNFAGNDYGRAIIERARGQSRVRLVDAVYDPALLGALRSSCELYLHGHSVGGTNPSLVEMLPYRRPIVAFDCVFNRHTLRGSGGYFRNGTELATLLESSDLARYVPADQLARSSDYRWAGIAHQYLRCLAGESTT